jgi:hypothetical protein
LEALAPALDGIDCSKEPEPPENQVDMLHTD